MNIAIAPLVSREGERIGRLIIFDDVTDRAELERRLVQADKLSPSDCWRRAWRTK